MEIFNIYKKLFKRYGSQNWWPIAYNKSNPAFEISVGAILTQNTAWKNVQKTLACLHRNELLNPKAIIKCPLHILHKCLRSSGYYRQKSKKLKIFCNWLNNNYDGKMLKFFRKTMKAARKELLDLWGIGPETADSILLYAGGKTIFVIDVYTKRLCEKFEVKFKEYEQYQKFFESRLPKSAKIFNEYHALIVASGKDGHRYI